MGACKYVKITSGYKRFYKRIYKRKHSHKRPILLIANILISFGFLRKYKKNTSVYVRIP